MKSNGDKDHEGIGHTKECGGDTCSKECTCGTCPPMPEESVLPLDAPAARKLLRSRNLLPNNQLTVVLEKIRVALRLHVSQAVLDEAVLEQRYDSIANTVVAHFGLWLWSNTVHKETQAIYVPKTWWDGLKEAHFPRFLKRRFPPRTRQIFVETKFVHVCPHLNIVTPKEERYHLQFLSPSGDMSRLR